MQQPAASELKPTSCSGALLLAHRLQDGRDPQNFQDCKELASYKHSKTWHRTLCDHTVMASS
jgi:hypothetical protein